jgi:preprotein translocase subunit SecA
MIDAILAKVFGTKNKREIKAIQPIVAAINDLEPSIQQLSDIDLAAKTIEFKEKLGQGAPLDDPLVEAFAVFPPSRYTALAAKAQRDLEV